MKNSNATLETLLFAKLESMERLVCNFGKDMEHETEFLRSIGFLPAARKTENLAATLQTFLATYRETFYESMSNAV